MDELILCFEGPSSVGKTTMCQLLSDQFNIVPEVNLLFKRTGNESKYWYHEKQVERYQLATQKPSILDGDIFQPIWYNWVCGYPDHFLSKSETHTFYKAQITERKIAFPDVYIIFHANEAALRSRKEQDATRQRRNFEKHLAIIKPLQAYYEFLDKETPLEMRFIEYGDLIETRDQLLATLQGFQPHKVHDLTVFEQIEDWIERNDEIPKGK